MAITEIIDKARIEGLLADDPLVQLEAIDENALGVEGIVSVFADDTPKPKDMVVVRWAQGSMGLRSVAHIRARTLSGLESVVAALPTDQTQYDALLPFWASGAIGATFRSEVLGAEAVYVVDQPRLCRSPVVRQTKRVTDPELLKPMFRKLADDSPAYALALQGALASVAAVTHLRDGVARISVYTVEEARRRGFGRGVLTALAEELLATKVVPTVRVDLASETAVRMVENAGFFQDSAFLRTRIHGRHGPPSPGGAGLVRLGNR